MPSETLLDLVICGNPGTKSLFKVSPSHQATTSSCTSSEIISKRVNGVYSWRSKLVLKILAFRETLDLVLFRAISFSRERILIVQKKKRLAFASSFGVAAKNFRAVASALKKSSNIAGSAIHLSSTFVNISSRKLAFLIWHFWLSSRSLNPSGKSKSLLFHLENNELKKSNTTQGTRVLKKKL